ncbi:MAG TPA: nucleoside-triphosphatase [bacterium]|nr:nucleoside-triphosphatase [bacterium]HQH80680.1 nucleoside-triphosphatase [bacterium]
MNIILSDDIDSGKSSAILVFASEAILRGMDISGWATPARMENESKVGHDFVPISNGKLGEKIPFTTEKDTPAYRKWRRFFFNPKPFELAASIESRCKIFLMDEIGPLELEDRMGFYEPFRMALCRADSTITVTRKSCLGLILPLIESERLIVLTLPEFMMKKDELLEQLADN